MENNINNLSFKNKPQKSISVIIPLFKGKKYINSIVEMLEKTFIYANIEYDLLMEVIFINDYPEEVITNEDIISDLNITLLTNDCNKGIHYSRVRGLNEAKGEFVNFLDQDDIWREDYICSQLKTIHDNDAVVSNGLFRNIRQIIPNENVRKRIEDEDSYFSTITGIVSPGHVLIRRKSIDNNWCKYIMNNNYCDDAFLWLLMKDKKAKFTTNMDIIYEHVEEDNNTSFNWKNNADSLEEMLNYIVTNNLLNKSNEMVLCNCVREKIKKHLMYYEIDEKLNKIFEKNIDITPLFLDNNIRSIAVYGYGIIGKKWERLCKKQNIIINYWIDNNISSEYKTIYKENEVLPQVDAIIITPVNEYGQIKCRLTNTRMRIISLYELLMNV